MKNGDKPAFATAADGHHQEGMTKRELAAFTAMQGLAANADWAKTIGDDWDEYVKRIGHASVDIADALLSALEQPES